MTMTTRTTKRITIAACALGFVATEAWIFRQDAPSAVAMFACLVVAIVADRVDDRIRDKGKATP